MFSYEVAELGAKAETKVDDAGKLTGEATEAAAKERRPDYARNADDSVKTKAKKEAETEIDKNDPDFASKQQTLIQAKEANKQLSARTYPRFQKLSTRFNNPQSLSPKTQPFQPISIFPLSIKPNFCGVKNR